MEANWQGISMTLVTFLLIAGTIVAHPYIKKVTNTYWFWLGVGVVLLVYVVIFRYQYNFSDFWKAQDKSDQVAARGLLLDLCPFVAFVLPITMIADPTRKSSCALAYFGIFGGLVNFIGCFCFIDSKPELVAHWSWEWIFVGDPKARFFFMTHFILLFFSPFVLLNSKRVLWKDVVWTLGFIFSYFAYVLIFAHVFHVKSHATGLVIGDWQTGGEYQKAGALLKFLPFPWITVVLYGLVYCLVIGVILLYIELQKHEKYVCNYTFKELFPKRQKISNR